MATPKQTDLLRELVLAAAPEDRSFCECVVRVLLDLGYVPSKQRVRGLSVAFKSNATKQTIAKISRPGRSGGRLSYAFKYYACQDIPTRFAEAVKTAIAQTEGQYECCGCGACGASPDDRGYVSTAADGAPFVRCGAYVVGLPDPGMNDFADLERLISEQHRYFLSRSVSPDRRTGQPRRPT